MSILNQIKNVNVAALGDLTDTTAGGGGYRILPEGLAIATFTGYVELGKHPQREYKGKPKPPASEFRLCFHIVDGGGTNEQGESEDYVLEAGSFPRADSWSMALGRFETSKCVRIFNAMNYAKDATHYVQLLGKTFVIPVTRYKDDKGNVRNNFDYTKIAPAIDARTRKAYDVPKVPESEYKLFLWEQPTQEQWDSIFIEGQIEAKDGKPARSKNFMQEKCLSALDFNGSALERLLGGGEYPSLEADDVNEDPELPAF